jgi:NitT/TauT family transport system substrate-binding protein
MKQKRITAAIVGFVIIFGVLAFFLLKDLRPPEKIEKLRMGVYAGSISALVYVAQQQGFFKRHGIDLTIENYQAGTLAVEDLAAGKVDMATAAEFVLALQAFKRQDLRTIGTVSASDNCEVIARRDRGIGKPDDLKGKRIGVSKGTGSEFFLNVFLSFNGIRPTQYVEVPLKPAEMVAALSEGRIDAATWIPPFTDEMKKTLAQNATFWSTQGGQDYYFLLITREELIKTRPHVINGLLKGVLEAEAFLKKDEKEARSIVERTLDLDREVLMSTWSKTRFRVGLDQNLLTLMEDEARWAIANKYVDSTKIPNYFNFLYLDGLKKIKPEAVSVIH